MKLKVHRGKIRPRPKGDRCIAVAHYFSHVYRAPGCPRHPL